MPRCFPGLQPQAVKAPKKVHATQPKVAMTKPATSLVAKVMPRFPVLQSFVEANVSHCEGTSINCELMYKKYKQSVKKNTDLSPINFLLEVKEVAYALWCLDVGPYRDNRKIRVSSGKYNLYNLAGLTFRGITLLETHYPIG